MSVEDIRSGLISVDIDCCDGEKSCGSGRGLLAQDCCQLIDIWSGYMLVRDFGVRINISWEHRCRGVPQRACLLEG